VKLKTNTLARAIKARQTNHIPDVDPLAEDDHPSPGAHPLEVVDLTHPDMERRLRAQRVWEFLDESKSTFYARMDEGHPSYDPLFPKPIPSHSQGRGPKRWKLGAVIAWQRFCEVAAHNS
jgi:predicted DNA-binding transcriptional regulator AlpA